MFDISPIQIGIVLLIALLIFGPRRLPEMGRSLGKGIRDFRSGITGREDDADRDPPGFLHGGGSTAEPVVPAAGRAQAPPAGSGDAA